MVLARPGAERQLATGQKQLKSKHISIAINKGIRAVACPAAIHANPALKSSKLAAPHQSRPHCNRIAA
jgi:hypothetical protein